MESKTDLEVAAVRSARKLGYSRLKEHQLQVILSFVEGNDVFGVLPTCYGKSLKATRESKLALVKTVYVNGARRYQC